MTTPWVLAHRGARRRAPENTIEAFRLACELGADGVELDVHRTADGDLVVDHDGRVEGLGPVTEHPQARIRAHAPALPTLREVFAVLDGAVVNVEIKNLPVDPGYDPTHAIAELVVDQVQAAGEPDAVVVSSFNLDTIDRVHALAPSLATGFLHLASFDPFDALGLAHARGHRAVHPQAEALAGEVAAALCREAHDRDVRVHVWTVNEPQEIERLADAGVDAIITDVPDVAVRVLRR